VLLIAALLLIVVLLVVIVLVRRVTDVPIADVPRADVPVEGASVKDSAEDINVIDVDIEDIAEDVPVVDVEIGRVLKTLYQNQILSQRSSKAERKPRRPRSQGQKTYVSSWSSVVIIEAETEEERVAREFDKKFFGRRASKRKSNFRDLNPAGRRPRDNKEKGDFRQDRRLKASRQKAVVESRAV
jgi:hypothetical protein